MTSALFIVSEHGYWGEEEVRAVGANWDVRLDEETSVTVDGDLITARGPPSSAQAAETLLDHLGK